MAGRGRKMILGLQPLNVTGPGNMAGRGSGYEASCAAGVGPAFKDTYDVGLSGALWRSSIKEKETAQVPRILDRPL